MPRKNKSNFIAVEIRADIHEILKNKKQEYEKNLGMPLPWGSFFIACICSERGEIEIDKIAEISNYFNTMGRTNENKTNNFQDNFDFNTFIR